MRRRSMSILLIIVISGLLTACGGSGPGSLATPSAQPPLGTATPQPSAQPPPGTATAQPTAPSSPLATPAAPLSPLATPTPDATTAPAAPVSPLPSPTSQPGGG